MDKISAKIFSTTVSAPLEPGGGRFYTIPKESTAVVLQEPVDIITLDENMVIIGDTADIPASVKYGPVNNLKYAFLKNCDFAFKVEDNVGINRKNATDAEVCLALYTEAISDEIKTVGDCYTGVKKSFLSAGIIDNYDDMPRGEAKDSISYFEENSERFRKLDVEEDDLKNLSAGKIVVFTKDGKAGHICITNGNGQAMSSSTDNMGWLDAEGDGADFVVYELTEGWQYNKETRKLEFTEP